MLAVAALAFASCEKEVSTTQEPLGTHIVTVKATKDFDTKTAIDEKSDKAYFVWTAGDEDYFHIYENGIEATSVTMALDSDGLATFTAVFKDTEATSFEYTAKYFKEESNKHNPLIVADQKPTLTSYDPTADVLIAQPQTKTEPATELQFALRRVATINKMTLKGMVAGEKIKTVELTSTDKNFSAYYVQSSDNYSAYGKTLTFDYSELADAKVGTDRTFAVYFVSAPVEDASISVKVTTDQYVYERVLTSKLTLSLGTVKRFGISLEGYGEIVSSGTVYTLVESAEDIQDGAYYIIVGSKNGAFQAVGAQTANNRSAVDVTVDSEGTITLDNSSSAHNFVLGETSNGYTFWDASDGTSGGYLYAAGEATSKQNYLRTSAELIDNAYWTITFSDGDISIVSVNNDKTPYLQYNSTSQLFSCYNSASQMPVSLYVDKSTCVELADPGLSFDVDLIEVNWDKTDSFTAPALNNPNGLTVTYSSSNPVVATVDPSTGEIAFVGNGETTITAKSERTSEFKAGEASYDLAVAGKVDFKSIAELNALTTSTTATMWDGSLENAIVSFVPDSKNAIIKDGTGSILVYLEDHGLKQGQTFSGYFTPTVKLFNGTAEMTDLDEAIFEGEETVVEPESVTLADLVGNLAKYQNAYVKVDDLIVTSVSGKTVNVTREGNNYVVYSNAGDATCVAGNIISVVGTIAHYGGDDQIKVWALDEITVTGEGEIPVDDSETIVFSELGLENGVQYSSFDGGNFTVTFAGGDNDGKYYTTGAGIRTYGGGSITIESTNKTIKEIVFTWSGSSYKPSGDVASPTGYSSDKWTGSAQKVTLTRPTGSGHWRLQSIKVSYE